MTSSKFKLEAHKTELVTPATGLIEKVAGKLAAEWFEAALSSGLKDDRYNKNPRKFAQAHLETFIPFAIKHLFEMLNGNNIDADAKMMVYDELMKRIKDPEARKLFPSDTMNDKHLNNFKLPENFFENNFPELHDPNYLKKKFMN